MIWGKGRRDRKMVRKWKLCRKEKLRKKWTNYF